MGLAALATCHGHYLVLGLHTVLRALIFRHDYMYDVDLSLSHNFTLFQEVKGHLKESIFSTLHCIYCDYNVPIELKLTP